jgi:hypothetical protein
MGVVFAQFLVLPRPDCMPCDILWRHTQAGRTFFPCCPAAMNCNSAAAYSSSRMPAACEHKSVLAWVSRLDAMCWSGPQSQACNSSAREESKTLQTISSSCVYRLFLRVPLFNLKSMLHPCSCTHSSCHYCKPPREGR